MLIFSRIFLQTDALFVVLHSYALMFCVICLLIIIFAFNLVNFAKFFAGVLSLFLL